MKETEMKPVLDARTLGTPKMLVLGLQHMFAMFGATVLVPAITGLSVSATLLFAGLGTLLFHLLTKRKVPAFLGSSFAFLAAYTTIAPGGEPELLPYACFGVACAGLLYLVISALFKAFGANKVMRFFPPIVTGPIIIAIGLCLSGWALSCCAQNWGIALVAIVVVIVCNIWGRGMVKIIPILLGIIASYGVAAVTNNVDFTAVQEAAWFGLPFQWSNTVFSIFQNPDVSLLITAAITIVPISIATIMEHIGDMSAISSTVGDNFIEDPGLHRSLLGDGLATIAASLFGAPANTTYGENTGVLNLTRVYDPRVIRLAAVFAIILSFSPKFAAVIEAMPQATLGGVSLILYGMISAVGVRNVVENQVDFTKSRNVIIAALILVLAVGIKYGTGSDEAIVFALGSITIKLSGIATAALVGIALNAVLPGNDYQFGKTANSDASADLGRY
ncbi:uracil-xanthine permease [Oscillibacter hominis]|uniref:Uracil-xanthine permease n=1 Tax=Oscillibacter hominis TaxID=2763056 RepID=A0A7G9B1Y1_9FIRM|nr:uracil-xanthine permease family protein [Oscillibacter hominis]QNL43562.1 uracil-xanthine permease [Oscillibacter hominis]